MRVVMTLTQSNNVNLESFLLKNSDKKFSEKLLNLQKRQFSGCLIVKNNTKLEWKIYLCLGRIIWVEGGEHPNRSWRRKLLKYSKKPLPNYKKIKNKLSWDSVKYQVLGIYLEEELITRESAINLIEKQTRYRLFDLLHFEIKGELSYTEVLKTEKKSLDEMFKKPVILLNTEQVLVLSQKNLEAWLEKGLVFFSPNLAPKIVKPEILMEKVPLKTYDNLSKYLDGKKSLRDLASFMEQDVLKLTVNLIPYVQEGILEFTSVEDVRSALDTIHLTNQKNPELEINNDFNKKLIVSVDDRASFSKVLGKVINYAGYRFTSINDNLNAVATLIKHNPDLILLDVDMPVINGFEICTQIRRVSQFKNTPIIMLTGRNDPFSKVKAKMAGANNFLCKSSEYQDLIHALRKYL